MPRPSFGSLPAPTFHSILHQQFAPSAAASIYAPFLARDPDAAVVNPTVVLVLSALLASLPGEEVATGLPAPPACPTSPLDSGLPSRLRPLQRQARAVAEQRRQRVARR
ncbi:Os04g0154500 [Oryza sativa Japonica Group]|uniref:Os04g0154500 protein n=1 Tax=Oryza sativa subsp. japonica TaxID=39947 RepID=A0A0P0W7G4_ORYSJ|nr:Os04g0154500 [Oryza sativa Japonica Group]